MSLDLLKQYVNLYRNIDARLHLVDSVLMTAELRSDIRKSGIPIKFFGFRTLILFKIRQYLAECFVHKVEILNPERIWVLVGQIEYNGNEPNVLQLVKQFADLDIAQKILTEVSEHVVSSFLQELLPTTLDANSQELAASSDFSRQQQMLTEHIKELDQALFHIQEWKDVVMFDPVMGAETLPNFTEIFSQLRFIAGFDEVFAGIDADTVARQEFVEKANHFLTRVLFEIKFFKTLRFDIENTLLMPLLNTMQAEIQKGQAIIRDAIEEKIQEIQSQYQETGGRWLQDFNMFTGNMVGQVDVNRVLPRYLESTGRFDKRWASDLTLANLTTIDQLLQKIELRTGLSLTLLPFRMILLVAARNSARLYYQRPSKDPLEKLRTMMAYWRLMSDLVNTDIADFQEIARAVYEGLPRDEWTNLRNLLSDEVLLALSFCHGSAIRYDHGAAIDSFVQSILAVSSLTLTGSLTDSLSGVILPIRWGDVSVTEVRQQINYLEILQSDVRGCLAYVMAEYQLLQKRWRIFKSQYERKCYLEWLHGLLAELTGLKDQRQDPRLSPQNYFFFNILADAQYVLSTESKEVEAVVFSRLVSLDIELSRCLTPFMIDVFELAQLKRYMAETRQLCSQVQDRQSYSAKEQRLNAYIKKYGNTAETVAIHITPTGNLLGSIVLTSDTGQSRLILDIKTAALIYLAQAFEERVLAPIRSDRLPSWSVREEFLQFFDLIQLQPCAMVYYELCGSDVFAVIADVRENLKQFFQPDFVVSLYRYAFTSESAKFFHRQAHSVLPLESAITPEELERNLQDMQYYHQGITEARGDKAYPDWQKKQLIAWESDLAEFQSYLDCFKEYDKYFEGLRTIEDLQRPQQIKLATDQSIIIFDVKMMLLVYLRKQARLLLTQNVAQEQIDCYRDCIRIVECIDIEKLSETDRCSLMLKIGELSGLLHPDSLKELYIQHESVIVGDRHVLKAEVERLELNYANLDMLIYNIRCLDQVVITDLLALMPVDIQTFVTEKIMKQPPWSPEWERLVVELYRRNKQAQVSLQAFMELLNHSSKAITFVSTAKKERDKVLADLTQYLGSYVATDACVEPILSLEREALVPFGVLGCAFLDIKATVSHYLRTDARMRLAAGTMTLAMAKSYLAFLTALPQTPFSNVPRLLEQITFYPEDIRASIIALFDQDFILQWFERHPINAEDNEQRIEQVANYQKDLGGLIDAVNAGNALVAQEALASLLSPEALTVCTAEMATILTDLKQALDDGQLGNVKNKFQMVRDQGGMERNLKRLQVDVTQIDDAVTVLQQILEALRAQPNLSQASLTSEQQTMFENEDITFNVSSIESKIAYFGEKLSGKQTLIDGLQAKLAAISGIAALIKHCSLQGIRLSVLQDLQQGMRELQQFVWRVQAQAAEEQQKEETAAQYAKALSPLVDNPYSYFQSASGVAEVPVSGDNAGQSARSVSPTHSGSSEL